jgi:nitrogen regulatory protein PII
MVYLVALVLDDPGKCSDILDAWEAAGANGITILESTGLGRVRRAVLRDDLPLMPSLQELLRCEESSHRTLFSVVEGQDKVDALVRTTQTIIGDLSQPHTGLLFVVPLLQVFGVHKAEPAPADSQH